MQKTDVVLLSKTLFSLHTLEKKQPVVEEFSYLLLVMPKSARDKPSANYDLTFGVKIANHIRV